METPIAVDKVSSANTTNLHLVKEENTPPEELPADHKQENPDPPPPKKIQRLVYSCPVDHSGTTVYVRGWCNTEGSDRPIVLVHDLGEEINLYKKAAIRLCNEGYNVYGFDLRGHGRSGRRLGHIQSFSVLIHDLLQVLAWVKHKEGGKPPLLIGQGVGALIALSFARKFPKFCDSVVLSAPCLELSKKVSAASRFIMKALSEMAPTTKLPRSLSPIFTDDSSKRTSRITANFANEVYMALSASDNRNLDVPGRILILCPTNDIICKYSALKKAVVVHDRDNITVMDVEDAGHHLFTESDTSRDKATEHIIAWLASSNTPVNSKNAEVPNEPG